MSLSTNLVSVIIPTYNRAIDLKRCLDSLVRQTYSKFEVIICDDGSSDNTIDVVESFKSILDIIYTNGLNFGGPARPRNNGIKLSNGEYIAFLDSDDWWKPKKLEISVNMLNLGFDVVYHDLWLVDITKKRLRKRVGARQLISPVYDDLIKNGNALPNSSVLVRKEVLVRINGFSEDRDLIAAEDFDCWLRLSKITEKFSLLPQTLGYYLHNGMNTSNPLRKSKNLKRLHELYFVPYLNEHRFEIPNWFMYDSARTSYLIGEKEEAKKIFKILLTRRLPFNLWFKVRWMLLNLKIVANFPHYKITK